MTQIDLTINTPSHEWNVYKGKTFTVQIKAWKSGYIWHWNVYALIFEGHPLHNNVDAAFSLPFHWGPSYDMRIISSPARGIQYNWQKTSDVLKLGSDYGHHGDYFEDSNPEDGIPPTIKWDARELAQELFERELIVLEVV